MHLKSKTLQGFPPTHCLKSLVVFKDFSSPNIAWLLMFQILCVILLFNAWPSACKTSPTPSKILFLLRSVTSTVHRQNSWWLQAPTWDPPYKWLSSYPIHPKLLSIFGAAPFSCQCKEKGRGHLF